MFVKYRVYSRALYIQDRDWSVTYRSTNPTARTADTFELDAVGSDIAKGGRCIKQREVWQDEVPKKVSFSDIYFALQGMGGSGGEGCALRML